MTYNEIFAQLIKKAEEEEHIVFADSSAKWAYVKESSMYIDDDEWRINCAGESCVTEVVYKGGKAIRHYAMAYNEIDNQYHEMLFVGRP